MKELWSENDLTILKDNYPNLGLKATAKLLGVSENRVRAKAYLLDLKSYARAINHWSEEEEQYLIDNYTLFGASKCAEIIKKSKAAISKKACRLKLTKPNYWTPEEEKYLKDNYKKLGSVNCSKILGRSAEAIIQQASRLKIPGATFKNYSHIAIEWLESFNNPNILHAGNGGEQLISGYSVDGYDPVNKIAYEFHGDVFHGNLDLFEPGDRPNPFDKRKTAEELWQKTYDRMCVIKEHVTALIYIWENDYRNGRTSERF